MSLILVGSYMVRYPLGGNLCWGLQWIYGLQQLGHEVYLVEKGWGWDCFDPETNTSGNDPGTGLRRVSELFERFELRHPPVFVDTTGQHYGVSKTQLTELFRQADLFIDLGSFGTLHDLAVLARRRVFMDLEPAYNQMCFALDQAAGKELPPYDAYYTNGYLIPDRHPQVPDCGVTWKTFINPIAPEMFPYVEPPYGAAFTTVMNWTAHQHIEYGGNKYGQKDSEFPKFMGLPRRVGAPMEVAVAGQQVPRDELTSQGWRIRSAHEVTATFDTYCGYIRGSCGEFSVAKNVFVATRSGWFSDRSNCYLASGRPVVLQDTGFGEYLPCGEGLFAVRDEDAACAAIEAILSDPQRHSRRALEIANDCLSVHVLLRRFLNENGL